MRLIDAELFRDELFRQYELIKVDDFEAWAVVDVDEVLDNIEEVEAIPIEWIEKYLEKWKHAETYDDAYTWWLIIKRDWEKENEAD